MVRGLNPRTNEYYTFMETIVGGYGGRYRLDGLDAVRSHIQNMENSSVEEMEKHYPILIKRYDLIPDSEGAGQHRGGLGVRRDGCFLDHVSTFSILSDGARQRRGLTSG